MPVPGRMKDPFGWDFYTPVYFNPPYKTFFEPEWKAALEDSIIKMAAEKAKKMEAQNKPYWLVINTAYAGVCSPEKAVLSKDTKNRQYTNEFDAIARAEQLAKDTPGMEFVVVKAVSRSFVEKTPAITTRLG